MNPTTPAPVPGDNQLTVAAVIDRHLVDRKLEAKVGRISEQHYHQTIRYLDIFKADFGHIAITECRRGDIKRWLLHHPEFRSPHTQVKAVGCVVTCFQWAESDGLIDRCPYSRPRDLPTPQPRCAMTRKELERVLRSAKQSGYRLTSRAFRLALWFCFETGCRTSEMRAICWEHYDDALGIFELPGKTTKKTGRKRTIVLTKRAWRLIRWLHRRTYDKTSFVFRNSQGLPWDKDLFSRRFRNYADLAGINPKVTAYSARHGFCVERLTEGKGHQQIAHVMGHSTPRFVEWYGRAAQSNVEYLRETAEPRRKEGGDA